MKFKSIVILIFAVMLVIPTYAIDVCLDVNTVGQMNMTMNQTPGVNGLNNMTMNLTPNLTANMTAGPQGIPGMANLTPNLTANMTAGPAGLNNMTPNMTPNLTANMTAGQAATISVNLTTTGPAGSLASVTNVGSIYAALLNFVIPQGAMNQTPNLTANMTAGPQGIPGMANLTPNLTANMTAGPAGAANLTPNLTANMTAGPQGIPGLPNLTPNLTANMTAGPAGLNNMTPNFTANMTAGPQGIPGLPNLTPNLTANMTAGPVGAANLTPNLTANMTAGPAGLNNMTPNMTPNLTAGPQGIPGAANLTPNLTANMTAGPQGIPGMANLTPNLTANMTAGPAGLNNMTPNFTANMTAGPMGAANLTPNLTANMTAGPAGSNAIIVANISEVIYKISGNVTGNPCMVFNNSTGTFTACYLSGDGTGITNVTATGQSLLFQVKADSNGGLSKGQAVYVSGGSVGIPVVTKAIGTNGTTTRVVGLVYSDINANAAGSVLRYGALYNVDTRSTNTAINPNAETWSAGDLLFLANTAGGLTKTRPTTGRSVKVAYALSDSSASGSLLAYPLENPVWVAAASGENVILRVGDLAGVNKISFRNYTNNETGYIDSLGKLIMQNVASFGGYRITNVSDPSIAQDAATKNYVDTLTINNGSLVTVKNTSYVLTTNTNYVKTDNTSYVTVYNTTYVRNPVYGYITLMSGSAMVTTTNPSTMGQTETSTNKNNYIYGGFTDGGTEQMQWIVDMPSDWNSSDATNGKITAYFLWTADSGSGNVKFDLAGKLFPDDAAIDTALASVGTATDTLLTAGDMHVSPATTAAVITSAGTGGQTAIIKVTRDSATDTLSATAKLIGVRIQYIRTLS